MCHYHWKTKTVSSRKLSNLFLFLFWPFGREEKRRTAATRTVKLFITPCSYFLNPRSRNVMTNICDSMEATERGRKGLRWCGFALFLVTFCGIFILARGTAVSKHDKMNVCGDDTRNNGRHPVVYIWSLTALLWRNVLLLKEQDYCIAKYSKIPRSYHKKGKILKDILVRAKLP